MIRISFFVILQIGSLLAWSQSDEIFNIPENALSWYQPIENTDSLKDLIPGSNPEKQSEIYSEIAYSLFKKDPVEAFGFANKALEIADSIDYDNGRVMALLILASSSNPEGYEILKSIRMLQKAESLMNEKTHWTMKYRVWFGIGGNYKRLDQTDSAMFYFEKPLKYLDKDEAWIAYVGAYSWLTQYARIKHWYDKELEYTKAHSELVMNHYKYHNYTDEKTLLASLEKLGTYYNRHGNFKQAVIYNKRVLDSIYAWNITPATKNVFIAKYMGKIGRAYHHWGKYDSAIIFHDSSLYFFDKVYKEEFDQLSTPEYPNLSEWSINYANQLEERAGVFMKIGNLDPVENDLFESIELRSTNNDILGVAMSLDKLGEYYTLKGTFLEAREHLDSAMAMKIAFKTRYNASFQELSAAFWNDIIDESISFSYLKLGELYNAWGNQKVAFRYFKQSADTSHQIGYLIGEAEALISMGNVILLQDEPDSSLFYYEKAGLVYLELNHQPGLAKVNESMGNYYRTIGNNPKALEKYSLATNLYQQMDMHSDHARSLKNEGTIYIEKKDDYKAEQKLKSALDIADKLGLKKLQSECNQQLAIIYENMNDIEKAFPHLKEYYLLNQELYTLEINKQITEIETRFNSETQQQQILLLQKENELQTTRNQQIIFIVVAIFILITIILLLTSLYIRQYRLKATQEKTMIQQKLFRSQMNPHFIFNSLASIQNSIINDEPLKASKYLARFSKLVRNILDSSVEEFIPLEEELATIENYLELQKIRFPEKFDYTIEVDEDIDPENVMIPPMLAQPFIENAIEHGIKHKETKGKIDVRFQLKKGAIEVEVEDDGIGRQRAQEILKQQNNDHKSLATKITMDRIRVINRKMKQRIHLEIFDLIDKTGNATGTKILIGIPLPS